jgi:hypothetical protein
MGQRPATTRLTPRRRCVLYLRAAGWSYAQIAELLGMNANLVRKDLIAVNKTILPGVTDGPEPAKGYRVIYVLGLLDAGVPADEVGDYLKALHTRASWVLSATAGLMDPLYTTATLADVAGR